MPLTSHQFDSFLGLQLLSVSVQGSGKCGPQTYSFSTSWELPSQLYTTISVGLWCRSKEPPDESERGEWKAGLKLNIQKTKIMASGPITSWQTHGETVSDFIFGAPKSLQMVIAAMKLKDAYSLE